MSNLLLRTRILLNKGNKMSQKNINDKSVVKYENLELESVDPELINNYSKLNEKCDMLINKVKVRKDKKKNAA